MKKFTSFDGIEIAYQEWGTGADGPPVFLHHGFIADANANWVGPGVVDALVTAGRYVVGIDARGHGASDKPHDPDRYGDGALVRDLIALFDVIGAPELDLVGYSMGGLVSSVAATRDGRIRRLILSGIGASVAEQGGVDGQVAPREQVAAILRTEHPENFAGSPAAGFRILADALGADREALATLITAHHAGRPSLSTITAATLVLCGRDDVLAARPQDLAAAIPGARTELVDGDHLTTLRDPAYASTVVRFLSEERP